MRAEFFYNLLIKRDLLIKPSSIVLGFPLENSMRFCPVPEGIAFVQIQFIITALNKPAIPKRHADLPDSVDSLILTT